MTGIKILLINYIINVPIKKFNINDNPTIINYAHVPNNNWAIINTNTINKKSDKIIFLNYPGSEKKIEIQKIKRKILIFKVWNITFTYKTIQTRV